VQTERLLEHRLEVAQLTEVMTVRISSWSLCISSGWLMSSAIAHSRTEVVVSEPPIRTYPAPYTYMSLYSLCIGLVWLYPFDYGRERPKYICSLIKKNVTI
jgi:hypothetical protein